MKQFIKIIAGILVILTVVTLAIGCNNNEEQNDIEATESVEESETSTSGKKQYIPPVLDSEEEESEESQKPEIPEETGPLSVGTDGETDFSGAADMH